MSHILEITLCFVFLFNYLEILYYLQIKEFRIDRLSGFISTEDGKKKIKKIALEILKTTIFYFLALSFQKVFQKKELLIILLTLFIFFFLLEISKKVSQKKLKRPKITLKILMIFVLYSAFSFLAYFKREFIFPIFFPVECIFLFMLSILLTELFSLAVKKAIVCIVKLKILPLKKNLTVIGITGSYGKSTTKEFLFHLLSKNFKTLKTSNNVNTEIGVALIVLRNLKKEHEIFIVEMGAYKKGEIKKICDIVQPNFGIITGIEKQHLSLFGNLENIIKTKFELFESVKEKTNLLFNLDSRFSENFLEKNKSKQFKTYSFLTSKADYFCEVLEYNFRKIKFKINDDTFFLENFPIFNLSNLIPAILIAKKLGIESEKIKILLKNLPEINSTFQIFEKENVVIIDDSYNSNVNIFYEICKIAGFFKEYKKILFTPGVFELGTESQKIHEEIGKELSSSFDEIIVTIDEKFHFFTNKLQEQEKKKFKKMLEKINLGEVFKAEKIFLILEGRVPVSLKKEIFDILNIKK